MSNYRFRYVAFTLMSRLLVPGMPYQQIQKRVAWLFFAAAGFLRIAFSHPLSGWLIARSGHGWASPPLPISRLVVNRAWLVFSMGWCEALSTLRNGPPSRTKCLPITCPPSSAWPEVFMLCLGAFTAPISAVDLYRHEALDMRFFTNQVGALATAEPPQEVGAAPRAAYADPRWTSGETIAHTLT